MKFTTTEIYKALCEEDYCNANCVFFSSIPTHLMCSITKLRQKIFSRHDLYNYKLSTKQISLLIPTKKYRELALEKLINYKLMNRET